MPKQENSFQILYCGFSGEMKPSTDYHSYEFKFVIKYEGNWNIIHGVHGGLYKEINFNEIFKDVIFEDHHIRKSCHI